LKIFALSFGMGGGLRHRHVLPVRYKLVGVLRQGGPGHRPLMAYEVLTAFFLEAGFLGVMLFA